jgi:hypothetical protein
VGGIRGEKPTPTHVNLTGLSQPCVSACNAKGHVKTPSELHPETMVVNKNNCKWLQFLRRLNAIKFSRAIGYGNMELVSNVSDNVSVSIIRDSRSQKLDINSILKLLIVRADFIATVII